MRSTLKFFCALAVAFLVMLTFRALVFTIYTVLTILTIESMALRWSLTSRRATE